MGKDKEAKEEERVKEEKWKRNMCQKIKMVTREKERHEKEKNGRKWVRWKNTEDEVERKR